MAFDPPGDAPYDLPDADESFAIQQAARLKWALNPSPTDEICCTECSYPDGLCSCRTFQPPATETP